MSEYGKIQKQLMTDIATAIREKKDTTAIFTPTQMAEEIRGIVMGDDLPNAEDSKFGVSASTEESAITPALSINSSSSNFHVTGWEFTPKEDISIIGITGIGRYTNTVLTGTLWDAETQEEIASTTLTNTDSFGWQHFKEGRFAEPINLSAGKAYVVSTFSTDGCVIGKWANSISFNNKITFVTERHKGTSNQNVFPSGVRSWVNNQFYAVNFIIGQPLTESAVKEYKTQTTTLDSIATEVMRITGGTAKMTPEEMITALQGVAVQTTA